MKQWEAKGTGFQKGKKDHPSFLQWESLKQDKKKKTEPQATQKSSGKKKKVEACDTQAEQQLSEGEYSPESENSDEEEGSESFPFQTEGWEPLRPSRRRRSVKSSEMEERNEGSPFQAKGWDPLEPSPKGGARGSPMRKSQRTKRPPTRYPAGEWVEPCNEQKGGESKGECCKEQEPRELVVKEAAASEEPGIGKTVTTMPLLVRNGNAQYIPWSTQDM